MRITDNYVLFWDGIFSQWWIAPFEVNNVTFKTAEHYMMYNKAMLFNDSEIATQILNTYSPRDVKALGRKVSNFDSALWESKCFEIVLRGTIHKFKQNKSLLAELLKYSDKEFVEASPDDKIWGIGLDEDHEDCLDPSKWKGQNLLGKALTLAAKILKETEC